MMRKTVQVLLVAGTLVTAMSVSAFAGTADSGPGCGLGKIAWQDSKLGHGIGPQLLISTTNNTVLPWQAFGITTGTLGCKNNGVFWAEEKTRIFADLNFEDLSQDMARGQGEHLASLVALMGIPEDRRPEFYALTQEKYRVLMESGQPTAAAMLAALHEAMASAPLLTKVSDAR